MSRERVTKDKVIIEEKRREERMQKGKKKERNGKGKGWKIENRAKKARMRERKLPSLCRKMKEQKCQIYLF